MSASRYFTAKTAWIWIWVYVFAIEEVGRYINDVHCIVYYWCQNVTLRTRFNTVSSAPTGQDDVYSVHLLPTLSPDGAIKYG